MLPIIEMEIWFLFTFLNLFLCGLKKWKFGANYGSRNLVTLYFPQFIALPIEEVEIWCQLWKFAASYGGGNLVSVYFP